MSILEVVLMILLGSAVACYLAFSIYRIVDRRKHPEKYDEKGKLIKKKKDEEE